MSSKLGLIKGEDQPILGYYLGPGGAYPLQDGELTKSERCIIVQRIPEDSTCRNVSLIWESWLNRIKLRSSLGEKRMADGPRLSPKCQMFFDRFVNRVNKQSPKPADWEYFYDFMSVCSDQKSEVTGVELYHLLIDAGFPQGSAQPLSMFYKQGWSLLNRPEGFDQIPTN